MVQSASDGSQREKVTTQRINEMAFAFRSSGTLVAAVELGLFSTLSDGPMGPAEVAEKTGMPQEPAERLLIACAALKLIEASGAGYVNAPDVDRYLVRGRPAYFGDYLVYQVKEDYDGWQNIARRLKPPKRTYHAMAADPAAARAFTVAGYNSSIAIGRKLAREFDFSRYSLFLDLGGGSGCYAIPAVQRHPGLRAIVFDQPNVVAVTREFIDEAGVADRVATHAGDFFDSEFPRGADLVAYITPLHSYGPDDVQFLIDKAFDAVEPGGGILIIDYMMNADRTGPMDSVFRHLGGLLSSVDPGYVNAATELGEYLARAGFGDVARLGFHPAIPGGQSRKPPLPAGFAPG